MNKVILAAALLLGGATGALAQPQPPSELERARTLIDQHQPAQALALLDPLVAKAIADEAKDPKAPCPRYAVAMIQRMMPANVTVTLPNDFCDVMLARGYALTELKRTAEAEQMLATLVGHDPQNPQYLIEYAFAVRSNGGNERALDLYRQAQQLGTKVADKRLSRHVQAVALRGQGFTLSDLGRWHEAVSAYKQSQRFEPDDAIAAHELQWIAQNRPH
ncbi:MULTISPECIES: hypothetical protein [Sphingomonas]|uniref:hypothetical protein n=1 Tax=Sphingomonas TaxID=13687 RepID=UPI000DEFA001|nr:MULTISPECIES: hypothetical protein [Sphingomonas]